MEPCRAKTCADSASWTQLGDGEAVSVCMAGGRKLKCVIVKTSQGGAVLVPLGDDVDAANIPTGSDLIIEAESATVKAVLDSNEALTAMVVSIGQGEAEIQERKFFRIKAEFEVKVSTDGVNWESAEASDLSEGGLFATCSRNIVLAAGRTVFLRLDLPQTGSINLTAEVVRTGPSTSRRRSFAAKFLVMPYEDRRQLAEFVYRRQIEHRPGVAKS